MSETLDRFFGAKTKQVLVKERCSNPSCRKLLGKNPKYTLRTRGKEAVYCQACAKKILRPQENQEEQCINSLTVFRRTIEKEDTEEDL